ncbi:hypothetical protein [Ruegeria sp. HKCCA6707]|uniref:hypothetical protein n=1 Tax=Ruegeria sp. HKCCA6707 TaxID=2682996 RepID=UPI0014878D48|nr:hypothetical protein [Ruegeria sp. HKCCA6707]
MGRFNENFDQAVERIATDEAYKLLRKVGIFDPDPKCRLLATRLVEFAALWMEEEVSVERFYQMLAVAKTNRSKFEGLNYALGLRVSQGKKLNEAMVAWISGILTKEVSIPASKGGHEPKASTARDVLLVSAVKIAMTFGLPATRNPASESQCAIDAVVLGLSKLEYDVSYTMVENAWRRRAYLQEYENEIPHL